MLIIYIQSIILHLHLVVRMYWISFKDIEYDHFLIRILFGCLLNSRNRGHGIIGMQDIHLYLVFLKVLIVYFILLGWMKYYFGHHNYQVDMLKDFHLLFAPQAYTNSHYNDTPYRRHKGTSSYHHHKMHYRSMKLVMI